MKIHFVQLWLNSPHLDVGKGQTKMLKLVKDGYNA